MKNSFYLLICLAVLAISCSSESTSSDASIKKKGEEGPLVERYMKEMIANPQTQNEIDQNIIINKLIDNQWDFKRTASGIYYSIDPEGTGDYPKLNSRVKCHYKGTLMDGREFDSSYKRGKPLEFGLGQVIAGWQETIPMLKKGGKGTFLIPSGLAYRGDGYPGTIIGANAVLLFEIELVDFK